jgi:hypothetical protein
MSKFLQFTFLLLCFSKCVCCQIFAHEPYNCKPGVTRDSTFILTGLQWYEIQESGFSRRAAVEFDTANRNCINYYCNSNTVTHILSVDLLFLIKYRPSYCSVATLQQDGNYSIMLYHDGKCVKRINRNSAWTLSVFMPPAESCIISDLQDFYGSCKAVIELSRACTNY